MLTKDNLKEFLEVLNFEKKDGIWRKSIGAAALKVDFKKGEITYPKNLKVNRRDIRNFSANENFVVFECVHRLLEKGYKPKYLELEPRWKVGRGASGGRADILVGDQQGKPLLLIECKTVGNEFNKAWHNTRQDGGQLFGYAQQIPGTKFLCLYTSDFAAGEIRIEQRIISHQDNDKILEQNKSLASFAKATDVKSRFAVWRDTYQLEYTQNGIFEDNVPPYQIGKTKYTLEYDTKHIGVEDQTGKYHEFRTILRKHNIARRENAFEVLVNLFLCKIVDEEDNKSDLKFYWKGIAYDNYFDFVDRLQDLYQKGMRKFLNEEISYISNEQIDGAFWTVKNKRNATKKQIQKYFRELKFFTNSAFSFVDTHNEKLFNKNAKVLLEVVQMWQGMRLKTEDQNQFLGDMFEYFLDNSIKQSNGQFFTPLPICKFIVASLPLAQKIEDDDEPLKVIDYACGVGHFLSEYAHQIKPLVAAQKRDLNDYHRHITGIEKEDRLAKVAKVAAYMYGQEQIKILDVDALAAHPEIAPNSFDVLIANPPFAVEGFLQTLTDDDKKHYRLIEATRETSNTNTIQCFFLERIHHLMAPGGVVGVIVPSSILSNSDAVHIGTRELLLKFFDLVSIAELGSGTFGKTGTNTVVLFLRRKAKRPEPADHYHNRVEDFFEGDTQESVYQDHGLIEAYCKHIEVPYNEYVKLFAQTDIAALAELLKCDMFKDYKNDFDNSTEVKNLKKSKAFKRKSPKEQKAELGKRFINCLHAIEKDKLYYFILAHEQAVKVLVVNAPSGNKEQKQYLGYEWSGAKGSEGIKYAGGETVNEIVTPLFNPKNLDSSDKINTTIKRNFGSEIAEPLPEHCRYIKLIDMLDFGRTDFNKALRLTSTQDTNLKTKWELVKLGESIETIESGSRPEGGVGNISSGALSLGGEHIHAESGRVNLENAKYVPTAFYKKCTKGLLQINDMLLCKDGALTGKVALLKTELAEQNAMVNEHVFILRCASLLKQKYIFNFLFSENGQNLLKASKTGSAQGGLNLTNLKAITIPFPPADVQQNIVNECDAVDKEIERARQVSASATQKIKEKVDAVFAAGYEMKKISAVYETASGGTPLSSKKEYYENGEIPWINSGEVSKKEINDADNYISELGLNNSNAKLFPKGTVLLAMYGATAGKVALLNISASTNQALCALLPTPKMIPKFAMLILESMYQDLIDIRTGVARANLSQEKIRNLKIPVPTIAIQRRVVSEIEKLEKEISRSRAVIAEAPARKNAILANHL